MTNKMTVQDSLPTLPPVSESFTCNKNIHSSPSRITLTYALIGALWIVVTDKAVEWLFSSDTALLYAQTIKGLLYVGTTSALVYWLARRAAHESSCKFVEDQLRLSQNLLQKVLSSLGEAVFVVDPTKRIITECNPAAERLFGFTRAELLGQPTQIIHVSQQAFEEFVALSESILEKHKLFQSEFRMKRKDETIIDTENTVTTIDEEIGWRGGVMSIVHDITARKRAEQSLRESEANFRKLLELLPAAVYTCDKSGAILLYNHEAVELWGGEPLTGERFSGSYRMYLPDGTPLSKERCPMAETLLTGKPVRNIEIMFERPDGSRITAMVNTAPITNLKGELVGAINSLLDITELKIAEDALQESGKRFQDLAEMLPEAIFEADNDLNLTYANQQAFSMFGYSKEDFSKGLNGIDMIVADDRKKIRENIVRRLRGDSIGAVEYLALRKDGFRFPVLFHSTPIIRQGSLEGFRGIIVDITERKRVEDALRESEKRFYNAFEFAPIGMALVSLEGKIIKVNRALCDLLGYSEDELLAKTYQDVTHPDYIAQDTANIEQMLAGTFRTYQMEKLYVHKQGHTIWALLSVSLVRDQQEAPAYFISQIVDITKRKQAEESLRMSEVRHRTLVDTIPDLVWLKDMNGVYLSCNPTFERFFGAKEAEIVGKTDYDFKDKDLADFFREYDRKALYAEGPNINEEWLTFADDGYHGLFETIKTPMRDAEGHILGVLGISRDITERKQATDELLERRRQLADIIEFLPDATLAIDKEKHIIIWNREIEKMTGVPASEMIGKGDYAYTIPFYGEARPQLMDLIFMEDKDIMARYPNLIREGNSLAAEVFCKALYNKKGAWVSLKASPLHNEAGNIIGAIESIRDITERKLSEKERENLQSQLLQAQKMESVGRLAGGVAHDFNNMLGIIIGHAELAQMKVDLESPIRADLEEVWKAANRSADLTRQLLAFARKQTISPKVLDLNEIAEGMLKMLRRIIGEDIDLAWLPGKNLWQIMMDPSQIDQILANLCINSRDAISGVGKITIETKNKLIDESYSDDYAGLLPGEYVTLNVSDNGTGMDAETQSHIFEPFFTTKEIGKGTGLGLATVYGIVKQNDGFIYVNSEPGKGTTFVIYLPRHITKSEKIQITTPELNDLQGQETILLVEDEPVILQMTTKMLERQGYAVLAANTPGEAIRIADVHTGPIHLVMTDVVMPEMNGRDLVKNLLIRYPSIKRLFMSGYTSNVIAHQGVLDPDINFIQKPFSIKNLAAKVREVLDNAND
jgi:two-component system, cell cycle sensor histidine kinase and response regulator CckA